MTTDQTPIGSGFGAKSTASEVLEGVALAGKDFIVTGGYSGIGLETVKALLRAGATVTVPARSLQKAEEALAGEEGVTLARMDLGDLASVRRFAEDRVSTGAPLHGLINNAGIMATPLGRVGPGWEQQFGTNHIGHFVLATMLEPVLKKAGGARVVALSSIGHARSDIQWDDPNYERRAYDKWEAYGQSKTADALFARGLDRRWRGDGVTAFSVHPGGIITPLQRHLPDEEMVALGWKNPDGSIPQMVLDRFKSPEAGAATATWAATNPKLNGLGGQYCEDCDISPLATADSPRWSHVRAWACSDEGAERLWTLTERLLANA